MATEPCTFGRYGGGVVHAVLRTVVVPEPYWERLRRLRRQAGLSQPALYRQVEDVGFDTIRALEQPYEESRDGKRSRSRYPSADTLEKISAALNVDAATFPEYRLAKARQMLDERTVGIGQALANLAQFVSGLDALAAERLASGAEPPSLLSLLPRATDDAPPKSQEGT
jgi:transcriptional regulator with XRE-family HTH domain